MKIAALCCTYKRPKLLEQAIACFLRQDYPAVDRELIILDDAGQYSNCQGDGWKVISVNQRFRTLGEKRNACAGLASPDTSAYCTWDDDDIYLPWHMSAASKALGKGDYSVPSAIYVDQPGSFERVKNPTIIFHGAWSFSRAAFEAVHGYPFIQSGQDQGLLKRFRDQKMRMADPLEAEPRPSYVYRWHTAHTSHISVMGKDGYKTLGDIPVEPVSSLMPALERDWVALHEQEVAKQQA